MLSTFRLVRKSSCICKVELTSEKKCLQSKYDDQKTAYEDVCVCVCSQHLLSSLEPVTHSSNVKCHFLSPHFPLFLVPPIPCGIETRNFVQCNACNDLYFCWLFGGQSHMVYSIQWCVHYLLPWKTIAWNNTDKTVSVPLILNLSIIISKYNSVFVSCSAENVKCHLTA